ncbi:MAG: VanZ family protein [Oscillospiraceae bacterium]|nr:VanZ family protein [Oscillospiraceae bacterium]
MKQNFLIRLLPVILTVCCGIAIFMFSRQTGVDSVRVSNGFLKYALAFYRHVPVSEISPEDIYRYSYLIRKLAHLFIYFVLGIFSCWSAYALFGKHYGKCSMLFCVLYAVSDELHQNFSSGRNAALRDVIIDSAGAATGIIFMCLVIRCVEKIKTY